MEITKAIPADIEPIMALIRLAVAEMQHHGIYQWDEYYPNPEIINGDIASGTLFKISTGHRLDGIIVLNQSQSPEYAELIWEDNGGRPLCVHRVCIHPTQQNKGLARRLMLFAEEYARQYDFTSIRLDTFSQNRIAQRLYESFQYHRTGNVKFRKGEFYCYEKLQEPNELSALTAGSIWAYT